MNLNKEPGAAHSGTDDWYRQRLSAVVLALLLPLPFFLLVAVYTGSMDQQGLFDILDQFVSRILHTILIIALSVHAYLGLKVILEDYIHPVGWRVTLIGSMLLIMSCVGIWWLAIIWAWGG